MFSFVFSDLESRIEKFVAFCKRNVITKKFFCVSLQDIFTCSEGANTD